MKHQTAVEYIIEKINPLVNVMPNEIFNTLSNIFLKAHEMEREQIIDAYCDGNPQFKDCGEEYYDEAYKK